MKKGIEFFFCLLKKIKKKNNNQGRGVWEPDHLKPHSQGGSNLAQNLVASCKSCNRERSDTALRDFHDDNYCQGVTQAGLRCTFKVAQGNRKFCLHHGF